MTPNATEQPGCCNCEPCTTSTQEAILRSARSFTMFSRLPTEIQLAIWKFATPDPRQIRGAIVAIIDLDLGKPVAILPSIREFKTLYSSAFPSDVDDDNDMFEELEIWDMDDLTMAIDRRPIFSLLHTCRGSRTGALATYRLDIASIIADENTPLWSPEDDMVCFILGQTLQEKRTSFFWLAHRQESPRPSLSSLQHIAFRLDRDVNLDLGVITDPVDGVRFNIENQWLHNFPGLQSFSLFIDPGGVTGWSSADHGKILLYEPEDVPIFGLRYRTASQIKRAMTDQFELLAQDGKEVPLVEVFVTLVRKPKLPKWI